ncbi:MAG: hypothetical protein FH756_06125 [Firmicutes bacterium]|nr:hypothetical protein [Bacillota bacterium]
MAGKLFCNECGHDKFDAFVDGTVKIVCERCGWEWVVGGDDTDRDVAIGDIAKEIFGEGREDGAER